MVATENLIAKNSRSLVIRFIGASGYAFTLEAGGDDFTDNNERPEAVVSKSRGRVVSVIRGPDPDAITGSLTVDFYTRNNSLAEAFLDVIDGFNGAHDWAAESTGMVGSPPVQFHTVTMEVTVVGAEEDGGNMVTTYEKTRFEYSEASDPSKNSVSVNWFCHGTITRTGPGLGA